MVSETLKSEELGDVRFVVFRERDVYIAHCPSLDISTSGETFDEAVRNFHEMFRLHIECCTNYGTMIADLAKHGISASDNKNNKEWNG